jgi:mRNA interferase YafQ
MNLSVIWTSQFKKDYKTAMRRNLDIGLLDGVIRMLAAQERLPPKYQDHGLAGNFKDYRECHIQPDWLLIYRINERDLILTLARTGSHGDLF